MATPDYTINYDDERFQQVDDWKVQADADVDATYDEMIAGSDGFYDDRIEASKQNAEKQAEIQNQQTQHTIDQINQQKDQANKDYIKEQSGAYVDWQKQSNQYGTEAEKMASAGLTNTGFSESSQVSMYNTYQNRVATAREVFSRAVTNYDNMIKDAQLQNNSILAEIAAKALEEQTQLALEGFQYKNSLIIEKANKKYEVDNNYWNRYLNVLDQINTENALAENARQFEQNQIFQERQAQLDREFQAQRDELNRNFEAEQAELNRKHDKDMLAAKTKAEKELLDKQHKQAMAKLKQQHQNDLDLLEKQQQQQQEQIAPFKDPDEMIANGSTKAEVRAEINKAFKNGYITQAERDYLLDTYCPRGLTY